MLNTTSDTVSSGTLATGLTTSPISYADALENYRKNTDWWVIFDAFDLPNAKGSALWLSSKTTINTETIIEALEGLTVLGLLKKSANGFEKVQQNINIPSVGLSKGQRIQDHATISRQILNHLGEDSRGTIRHTCFASNLNIVTELYSKIDQLIHEAQEKSRALTCDQIDNVYLATYTAVNSVPNGKGAAHV